MSLTLHFHPLASFCWKPLIALYENATPFAPVIVDLGDEQSRAAFLKISPTGKMPALRDDARDRTVLE
ncbi:glutathione S-transferase family protein, partial [Mesorhizobium sp. M8A.F.Ca.ET.059.01.1.1]